MALLGALINVTVTIVAMRYVKMFVMKKSKLDHFSLVLGMY